MPYNKNFNKNNNERINNVSEENNTGNDRVSEDISKSEVNDSSETKVEESEEIAEADAEEKTVSETVGTVIECETLRVRKKPSLDGEILTTIHKGSQVVIDLDKSTKDFYKINYVAGVEGYCMKKFIAVK